MSQASGDAKSGPGAPPASAGGDPEGRKDAPGPAAVSTADASGGSLQSATPLGGGLAAVLEQRGVFLALCVVLLGLALRLPGFFDWWLNPDEGIYFSAVTYEGWGDFWREARISAHPPLYFLILRGVGWFSTDFTALRLVALLSGCGAVFVFALVGREVAGGGARGWVAGLAAGLILAVAPRAIILSQVIRPYMLLALVLAGALYALLRYRREAGLRYLGIYAVLTTVAALLHYSALLAFACFGVMVLVDGARRGVRDPAWWRLLGAQIPPVVTVGLLYLFHLRNLMALPGAENATEGWLGQFMIRSPGDLWLSLAGFHAMLAGQSLAGAMALVTVAALGVAVWRRAWTPLLVAVPALAVAALAAGLRLYPFGATRHTAWLLVFVTPLLGWLLAEVVTARRRLALAGLGALAVLALAGEPLGRALGAHRAPMEISEQVLERGHVAAMAEILDPGARPEVILMSTETYTLLMPLYVQEHQRRTLSPDGILTHFRWGERDVVVLPTRDFTVLPSQVGYPNHLLTVLQHAAVSFPDTSVPQADTILVLAGGWRSQGMADLADMARRGGDMGSQFSVPGLIAAQLDVAAYGRAVGLNPPPPGQP